MTRPVAVAVHAQAPALRRAAMHGLLPREGRRGASREEPVRRDARDDDREADVRSDRTRRGQHRDDGDRGDDESRRGRRISRDAPGAGRPGREAGCGGGLGLDAGGRDQERYPAIMERDPPPECAAKACVGDAGVMCRVAGVPKHNAPQIEMKPADSRVARIQNDEACVRATPDDVRKIKMPAAADVSATNPRCRDDVPYVASENPPPTFTGMPPSVLRRATTPLDAARTVPFQRIERIKIETGSRAAFWHPRLAEDNGQVPIASGTLAAE